MYASVTIISSIMVENGSSCRRVGSSGCDGGSTKAVSSRVVTILTAAISTLLLGAVVAAV